jgi:hypothetical protein
LGIEKLGLIWRQISDRPATISRRKIQDAIATVVSPKESRQTTRFLMGAAVTMRRRDLEADDFVEGISTVILARRDREARFVGWNECRPEVVRLLNQRWLASSRQCFALDKWSLCRLIL